MVIMQTISNDIEPIFSKADIYNILKSINDPEIPVLSIVDLGIVRGVFIKDGNFEIIITPTYSGCPAMDVITMEIRLRLLENEIKNFKIIPQLSPAWTTEWMTEEGKQKLSAYGIAPPTVRSLEGSENSIQCPQCHSYDTKLLSEFGSTSCKSLYQCNTCNEPFDYFKCH